MSDSTKASWAFNIGVTVFVFVLLWVIPGDQRWYHAMALGAAAAFCFCLVREAWRLEGRNKWQADRRRYWAGP